MKTEATDIPRRTWAPFVGAALAALTAGSLVVFSLIAQRTSLDGFPDRRITPAESAGDATPSSITIAPVDDEGSAGEPRVAREAPAESAPSATALLEVAEPTPPASSVVATVDTSVAIGDEETALAGGGAPTGTFRAEQPLLTRRAGGGSYEQDERYAAGWDLRHDGWDLRHDGRHTHKSHDLKDGRKKARAKAKAARKRSKTDFKAKAAGRKGIPAHAARNRGGHGAASNSNPPRPAKPARSSSRPAPASREATGRSRKSAGSPPAHSNAGGNGKSRGRGHGKH